MFFSNTINRNLPDNLFKPEHTIRKLPIKFFLKLFYT